MREIVLATGNPGKVAELQSLLQPLNWRVRPQSEWALDDADETGLTFVENAIIKARHAAAATGLPALADDSGLAVQHLNGAPGIYSARFAGQGAADSANIDKLLSELQGVPEAQRQASFHCVLVYLEHAQDPTPLICHGSWHGSITTAPSGNQGFGYDSVFWVASEQCTAAELSAQQKQQLGHRGKALRALLKHLSPPVL